ncbi:MAG: aspartate kinase [Alphaproteobacteria bacterium]|nr:aspartate kinase [Alphaproteobacteria bacterium]
MSLYVLKFGGSSIATLQRISNVANIITDLKKRGNNIIVVTSAMQGITDKLLNYTKQFVVNSYENSYYRECDAVVSCGESIAAGILSLALQSEGIMAKSFNSWQIPIEASTNYSNATITNVNTKLLFDAISDNIIPVITGFQGLTKNNDIVTLGRGGSDATACALAYYTNADECYIYTDVSGVFTADPRVVTNAKLLKYVSYDEMIELAKYGAKVLQYKSVLLAKHYNVKVRVLSSFLNDDCSSLVTTKTNYINNKNIAGIAHSNDYVLLRTKININNIISKYETININNFNYLVKKSIVNNIANLLQENTYTMDNDIGTITIVGSNINSIIDELTQLLIDNNISIKYININNISITYIVYVLHTEAALNILHKYIYN